MPTFKVIILAMEANGGFYGHVLKVKAQDKNDARLEALVTLAMADVDLNKVTKTRVTELTA